MTPRAEVMRRVLGALALLALLGAVLWWTASSKDDAGLLQLASVASAPTATPHAVSTRPPPAPGAAEHPAFRRDPTPLPPAGTPVAAMLPDLKRRADAGDTRAACRLGVELIRCRLVLSMMDAIAGQMRDDKAEANGAP